MVQPLWYVRKAGLVSGPFPSPQISEGLRLGEIKPRDEISLDGLQWEAIQDSGQFGKRSPEAPPETDDATWTAEREKARQRWESSLDGVGEGAEISPMERARREALREAHDTTRSLVQAQARQRPSWAIAAVALLVVVLIGVFVWILGQDKPTISASISKVASCEAPLGEGVSWSGCNKSGLTLDGQDLHGMLMQRTRLDGASLTGADLSYADLTRASLRGANLRQARLMGTMLEGADLTGADLSGADVSYASLIGANLEGARLDGVVAGKTVWVDGRLCDQMDACR